MSSINIEGLCEQIMFHNESNGYTVFKLKVERRKLTCVGVGPQIKVGQTLRIEGKVEENPKYGQQINCEVITVCLPKDKAGILKYLSSGIIPGIGEGFAKKLVDFVLVVCAQAVKRQKPTITARR